MAQGEGYGEGGAVAGLAGGGYGAAVELDEGFGYGETYAGAVGVDFVYLEEAAEDVGEVFGRDTAAGVGD